MGRSGAPAWGEWEVREEREPVTLADADDLLGGAIDDVVRVLNRDDSRDAPGPRQLRRIDIRDADVADLPLRLEVEESAD